MKKLLINLALLSLGALAFAGATLIPPMTAQAAAGTPPAPGVDWTFWIALVSAILSGMSIVLHVVAPRTKNTWDDRLRDDVDAMLSWWKTADPKPAAPALAVVPPPGSSGAALVVVLLLGAMAAPALSGCSKAEAGAAATAAGHAVVNCTGQAIGTTPALDLATLIAVASQAQEIKTACTSGGRFDWSCAESAAIAKGVTVGGCALAQLFAGPPAGDKPAIASTAVAPTQPDPGRAAFEDFRARVAGGALFHTAAGDL